MVILRYCHDDIIYQSLASLKNYGKKWYQEHIHSVIIIQRMRYGQYYIVEGLCRSPHFSLGPIAAAHLRKMFDNFGVKVANLSGYVMQRQSLQLDNSGLHVLSSYHEFERNEEHELGYKSLLLKLSKEIWRPLLMVCFIYHVFDYSTTSIILGTVR